MSSVTEGKKLHKNESIKANSVNLRGTLAEELNDLSTGSISADNGQLSKFHGMYLQDDRDVRSERRSKRLEKAFSFMLRARITGGRVSPEQYLRLDKLANEYANKTIRLTTRQTIQFHGLLKGNVRNLIRQLDQVGLSSIGACGDINRNVMCYSNLADETTEQEMYEYARKATAQFLPVGSAYYELFIDGEKISTEPEVEPIYGKTYLPRKFKIGFAVPPNNDIDVFAQDLGFIAIYQDGKLQGFNVTAGGGMGMTHGNDKTYPRLGSILGFIKPEEAHEVAEAVVTTQRDYGDRENRSHARLKYTIDDHGVEWFTGEVERRSGVTFQPAREFKFTGIADPYGWHQDTQGKWFYTQFVQNGRIKDTADCRMMTAFREIAKIHQGEIRMTGSQNLAFTGIDDSQKEVIQKILDEHQVPGPDNLSGMRRNAMACVALPTCGLALAESERTLPDFISALEDTLDEVGLRDEEISIRMTGCPNGCARPYLAEIGLVGKGPNKYNLYLGANYEGLRLNNIYAEGIASEDALEKLRVLLKDYAKSRQDGERFGEYCLRVGLVAPNERTDHTKR